MRLKEPLDYKYSSDRKFKRVVLSPELRVIPRDNGDLDVRGLEVGR